MMMKTINQQNTWRNLLSGKNGLKIFTLAAGVVLHATDVYLATTIMPSVVSEIGGVAFYSWATTVYVVAAIVGSVISSSLMNLCGPRKAYGLAAITFAIGAVISAISPNMAALLTGRFIQGIGGGALFSLAYSMIRIVFDKALWPRAIALVSAMWGLSAFTGPLIGGLFAEFGHWRLAFVTLSVCGCLLIALIFLVLPSGRSQATSVPAIPWGRLCAIALASFAISVSAANSSIIYKIAGFISGIVLLMSAAIQDHAGKNTRLLPKGSYNIKSAFGSAFGMIALLSGCTTVEIYLPYFMKVIYGFSPLKAGYLTVLIAIGWSVSSVLFSGIIKARVSALVMLGLLMVLIGLAALSLTMLLSYGKSDVAVVIMIFSLFSIGMGVGMGWPHILTKIMTLAPDGQEELTSGSITTVQLISTALGTALCGLIVNATGILNTDQLSGSQNAAAWLFGLFTLAPLMAFVLYRRLYAQKTP